MISAWLELDKATAGIEAADKENEEANEAEDLKDGELLE
jgi:hypothetical protein